MRRKIILLSIFFIITIPIIIGIFGYLVITNDAKLDSNKLNFAKDNIILLDDSGEIIENTRNSYVKISHISPYLINAFISLEDKRFYEHKGIDYVRMAGAAVKNLKSGGLKEGASTITQQLVKNTHLSNEKTFKRKLKEIKLARKLESKYSKDEILEMYLNVIYFGSGVYGVDSASKKYFNKTPINLNLNEACMLAGIVKNPKKYSPINNFEESVKRKNVVLKAMYNNSKINEITLNNAINDNIIIENGLINNNFAQSYANNVFDEACSILKIDEKFLLQSNLKIETYMDKNQQKNIEKLAKNKDFFVENYDRILADIDNQTLGVKSYYSSIDIADRNISRQGGSALKPFNVYLPAIMNNKIAPATQILDEKTDFNGYTPQNYGDVYHGYVSSREALANSYNIPAVKILSENGIDDTISLYSKIGHNVMLSQQNLSLALGANNITPLMLASTYSMLANAGEYNQPKFIKSIHNNNGELLYSNDESYRISVCGEDDAFLLTDMLMSTSEYGTAKKLKYLDFDIASKTGTVQAGNFNTDAWCIAYTTDDTFMVWNGNNNNKALPQSITGGSYPTLAIKDMAEKRYNNTTSPKDFIMPESVNNYVLDYDAMINDHTLILSDISTTNIITEIFKKSFPPIAKDLSIGDNLITNLVIMYQNNNLNISFKCRELSDVQIFKHELFGKKLIFEKTATDSISFNYKFGNLSLHKISVCVNDKEVYKDVLK